MKNDDYPIGQKKAIRKKLIEKLKEKHCFWSYDVDSIKDVPDDMLVELAMLHLDLNHINLLFQLFPKKEVKRMWLENVVAQGERYYVLNRAFAWYYFGIKRPGRYVKAMATKLLNKRINQIEMSELEKKWAEVLDYARQHATGQGSRTGFRWLEDAFNEYFQQHEEAVEDGTCASFGGQSFSQHNREVLAEKICLELGHHIGGQHLIDEEQEARLKESLVKIVESAQRSRGFRR